MLCSLSVLFQGRESRFGKVSLIRLPRVTLNLFQRGVAGNRCDLVSCTA